MMNKEIFSLIAYIDPGTGGLVLQLLMASVVGAVFYFRRTVGKLVGLVFKRKVKIDEREHRNGSVKQ